jgi:hypothetical protein
MPPRPLPPRCLLAGLLCTVFALAHFGCAEPTRPRLNAPPQGESSDKPEWGRYFDYHDDQGMLADMSIADIHFVPHSAEISGVGEVRLERYAELLARTGGRISYDTSLRDQALVEARLANARTFLKDALPTAKTIDVVLGLPGGRGMTTKEASLGKAVAEQPEPRSTAYKLKGSTNTGGS